MTHGSAFSFESFYFPISRAAVERLVPLTAAVELSRNYPGLKPSQAGVS